MQTSVSQKARQRLRWFDYYRAHGNNAALTCRYFGISRQTFYRWKRRYDPGDLRSWEERSHRPHRRRQPTWTPLLVERVLALRRQYPRWGKDKRVVLLGREGQRVSTSLGGRILPRLKKIHAYGCRFVNFTGGEPTLRRDLEEIINAASCLGMWSSMVTNGSLLTRQRVRDLKQAGLDNLFISLDSIDPSAHDAHRGILGLHAQVLNCLEWLSEDFLDGHRTGGIMCVLSHRNLHEVKALVRLADDHGVYAVFQPYHQNKTGDGVPEPLITKKTVDQLRAVKQKGCTLLSSRRYLTGMFGFFSGASLPRCQAGYKYFSVDPYGYLHPRVDTPSAGHILKDDMSVIRSEKALRSVTTCRGCWYCFRGEADSTLSAMGYMEKLCLAFSVVMRNALRRVQKAERGLSVTALQQQSKQAASGS